MTAPKTYVDLPSTTTPILAADLTAFSAATFAQTVGYDIIVAAGQSNMSGRGTGVDTARLDPSDPRIWVWGLSGSYNGVVSLATEPLPHPDAPTGMGPALTFARWYAHTITPGRRVLIVPTAVGGTGFSTTPSWRADLTGQTNNYYDATIAAANAAVTAAGSGSRIAAILWLQGEADVSLSKSTYAGYLDALISGLRSHVTGATSSTPFILGGMVPEYVTATSGAPAIDAAHQETPARNSYAAFAPGVVSSNNGGSDTIHYNAAGQRLMGKSMFVAYPTAANNTFAATVPGAPRSLAGTTGSGQVVLTWVAPQLSGGSAITDYIVQYRTSPSGSWTTFADGTSATTGATVTGLTNGTAYDFQVAAVNTVGTGAYCSTTTATPGASAVVSDNFNRSDTTTGLGTASDGAHVWAGSTAQFRVLSNRMQGIANSSDVCTYLDAGVSDFTLQATNWSGAATNSDTSLVGRYSDDSNYWMAYTGTAGTNPGKWGLWKKQGGAYTQMVSSTTAMADGQVVQLIFSGTTVTLKVNGTQVAQSTGQTFNQTATKVGFRTGVNTVTAWDDLTVT